MTFTGKRTRSSYTSGRYNRSKKFKKAAPYRRKSWAARSSSRKISKIARSIVMSTAESKDKTYGLTKVEMYHNLMYAYRLNNNTIMPAQGSGDSMRNGDSIISRGFQIRTLFGQKYDRPNVTWRVAAIVVPNGFTVSYASIMKNVVNNVLLDEFDKDKVTVLWDKTFKPYKGGLETTVAGSSLTREFTFPKKFWVTRKKTIKFIDDSDTNVYNDREIHICTFAYDAYGTSSIDNIGYHHTHLKFIYKDP